MPDTLTPGAIDPIALVEMTADLVAAYVERNHVRTAELPILIATTHAALAGLAIAPAPEPAATRPTPAVPIKRSITDDYLVCLDDGKRFMSLKRHLAKLGMTPDDYRAKWGLSQDYPMVSAAYSRSRSALAKGMNFGKQRRKR